MKRPTGVTVIACILLFMASGVANGLVTVLPSVTKLGLALYVVNISLEVMLAFALLRLQKWSRWVFIVLCVIGLAHIPREMVEAHSTGGVVRTLGWGSFKAWSIWYLFLPNVKAAFHSTHPRQEPNNGALGPPACK